MVSDKINLANAYVTLIPTAQGAQSAISNAIVPAAGAAGMQGGQTLGQQLSGALRKFGPIIGGIAAAWGIGKYLKSSVDAFVDLNGQVNSLRRITGGSVETVSGLAGAMRLSGMDTEKATGSLTIFSKKLGGASGDAKKMAAMNDLLGTSFLNADGSMRDMSEILPEVANKFKSMPDGIEKTSLATQLFGRSGTEMLPFLNKGADGIEELTGKAKSLGLVLDDGAKDKWAAYRAAVRTSKATFDGLKVTIGGAVLPVFTSLASFGTDVLGPAIASVIEKIQSSESLPRIMGSISDGFHAVTEIIGPLLKGFVDLHGDTSALSIVADALANNLPAFKDALKSVADAVGGLLIAAMKAAKPVVEAFGDVARKLASEGLAKILPLLTSIGDWISGHTELVTTLAVGVGAVAAAFKIWTTAVSLWNTITKAATALQVAFNAVLSMNPIGLIITAIAGLVAALIYFFTQTETGKKVWETLVEAFKVALDFVGGVFTAGWQALSDFFSGLWEGIKAMFNTALQFILDLFLNWTLLGLIISHWESIRTATVDAWNRVVDFVKGIPQKFIDGLQAILGIAMKMREWVGGIRQAAVDKFTSLVDFVKGIPQKIKDGLGEVSAMLWDSGRKIIQGLIDGITSKIDAVKDAVGGVLKSARNLLPFSPAKEGPFSGRGWTLYSGESIMSALAEGVSRKGGLFTGALSGVLGEGQAQLDGLRVPSVPVAVSGQWVGPGRAGVTPASASSFPADVMAAFSVEQLRLLADAIVSALVGVDSVRARRVAVAGRLGGV